MRINDLIIEGNLTRDPELKYTNSGKAICSFPIAYNDSYKKGDEWIDAVSYFDVVAWGENGEKIQSISHKGDTIRIMGNIKQDRWDKDGQKHSAVKINLSSFQLVPKSEKKEYKKPGEARQEQAKPSGDFEDDPPF